MVTFCSIIHYYRVEPIQEEKKHNQNKMVCVNVHGVVVWWHFERKLMIARFHFLYYVFAFPYIKHRSSHAPKNHEWGFMSISLFWHRLPKQSKLGGSEFDSLWKTRMVTVLGGRTWSIFSWEFVVISLVKGAIGFDFPFEEADNLCILADAFDLKDKLMVSWWLLPP